MESWTIRHFSLSNPAGPGRGSVPTFLRRLSETIEKYGDIEVQDIVFRRALEDEGWYPEATVYFMYPEHQ